MAKHIKTDHGRPVETPKQKNWARRQRRRRLKARRSPEFMATWAGRSPAWERPSCNP